MTLFASVSQQFLFPDYLFLFLLIKWVLFYSTASKMSLKVVFSLFSSSVVSPTSVYLRAAAPIIKVVFSGHLVSGEPLNISFPPGVFNTHNSSLSGFSLQSPCCLSLFFVSCSWKTRRVASERVFPRQQTLLMGNRVDPHFCLSRHSDCTEHPETLGWRFNVRPSRLLPPQGQTKAS